ncbi:hypothetical protein KSP39_PZI009846 [Platanthera zijinensis]|uniref:Transmembrane protein n=1 Tax=Platanthera zijinensis TaxID=2320716 RepID=A0AAP0BIA9_9ASPA
MDVGKKEDGGEEIDKNLPAGWNEKMQREWKKIREHAETYPYVWGSYILVYGSFGVYFTYRWRKLRQTEDRVRILREQLRKLSEEGDAASSGASSGAFEKPPSAKSVPTSRKVDEEIL